MRHASRNPTSHRRLAPTRPDMRRDTSRHRTGRRLEPLPTVSRATSQVLVTECDAAPPLQYAEPWIPASYPRPPHLSVELCHCVKRSNSRPSVPGPELESYSLLLLLLLR